MAQISIRRDPRGWYLHQTYSLGAYRLFAGVPTEIDDPAVVQYAKQVITLLVDESPSVAEPAPAATVEAPKQDAAVSISDTPTTKEKK